MDDPRDRAEDVMRRFPKTMERLRDDPRDEALRACVEALEASKATLDMLTAPRTIKASSAIQAWGHCVETELVVRKALATARAALEAHDRRTDDGRHS